MQTIEVLDGKITVKFFPSTHSGAVTDTLHEECPFCSQPMCAFSCDQSKSDGDEDEVMERLTFNGAVDGLSSLLLAMVCRDLDITDKGFQGALQDALDACGNN